MRFNNTLISIFIATACSSGYAQLAARPSHQIVDPAGLRLAQFTLSAEHFSQEFAKREQQIQALLSAYRTIQSETGSSSVADELGQRVAIQLQQASSLYQSDNADAARHILERAYNQVRDAIIQARDGKTVTRNRAANEQYQVKSTPPRHQSEYERTLNSMDALLSAYRRVAAEKGQHEQGMVMTRNIAAIKTNANKHYHADEHDQANQLVQGGYTLVKAALANLREGDTLTQSLDFATPQDEYDYYVRKTQSQKTALDILQQVSTDAANSNSLGRLLASSQDMLDKAAVLAAKGDFDAAIPLMSKVLDRLQSGLMMSLSAR